MDANYRRKNISLTIEENSTCCAQYEVDREWLHGVNADRMNEYWAQQGIEQWFIMLSRIAALNNGSVLEEVKSWAKEHSGRVPHFKVSKEEFIIYMNKYDGKEKIQIRKDLL